MRDEKGFALVFMCLALPLLIFTAQSVGWLLWFQGESAEVNHLCHKHLLIAQRHLIQGAEGVMALNPLAKSYTLQKKLLKAALRAAPVPLKPPLVVALQRVIVLQWALKAKQQALLFRGQFRARQEGRKMVIAIRKKLKKTGSSWDAKASRPKVTYLHKNIQLKVAYKDIAPQYEYKSQYAKKQELKTQWGIRMQSNFNRNFQLKSSKNLWTDQCFSHPRKRRNLWTANLGEAKSF